MITTAQFELSRPQQGYSTTRPRRAGNMLGSTELCGYLGWFFFLFLYSGEQHCISQKDHLLRSDT